jgi:predicted nucleic acid-binding Zn ribbon protein
MVYDYKCKNCDKIWSTNHSIHIRNAVDEIGLKCPECDSSNIFKYLGNYGSATIVFQGTGWAHKDLMLDKIGMPKTTQNSPEAQKALKRRI